MYFASRAASPRNPKELLDRAAKGDERGRRSDPRQWGVFISEVGAIKRQISRRIGPGHTFFSVVVHFSDPFSLDR